MVGRQRSGRFRDWAKKFELASRLDPQYPDLQYRLGGCLLALTNYGGARERRKRRVMTTPCRFAPIHASIRRSKSGAKFADDGWWVFDVAAALASNTPAVLWSGNILRACSFDFNAATAWAWTGRSR